MDPNLLAFLLSGCFTAIIYLFIVAITKGKKGPGNDGDAPRGPVTVDL